jgi:mercuric ion transport protein
MGTWQTIRGWVAGAGAFIVCPCHLPLTLPLFIALTAGTAVGGWLANNTILIYVASTLLFIGGLALARKWFMTGDAKACAVKPQEKQPA